MHSCIERLVKIAGDAEAKRMHDEGMVTVGHMREQIAAAREAATEEANRRTNASWTLMCEKMVAAEREACAQVCDDLPPPDGYNMTEIGFWDITSLACGDAIRARSA